MELAWTPPPEWVERSVAGRFLAEHGLGSYAELEQRSLADPSWFWDAVVRTLELPFDRPYDAVLDDSAGAPFARWFVGGEVNLALLALRHADRTPDAVALVAEREDGVVHRLTWSQLAHQVASGAGALKARGVRRGDPVGLFLPYTAEAAVALLACAWAGAVAVPVFSGVGAPPLARRLRDSGAKVLVTADGALRRGRSVPMLATAEEAARDQAVLLVVDHLGTGTGRHPSWAWALAAAGPVAPARTGSEEPFLVAYTSGTTGMPKGAVHVHGGFGVQVAQEAAFGLDVQAGDTLSWMTDLGWIMGAWTVLAGLLNGATVVMWSGAPDPAHLWAYVDRHAITHLGVSPTLIRAVQAAGDGPVRASSRASLRAFAATGEPWTPAPWRWLFETVGERRRPIVNISGGTEAGVLLGVQPLCGVKPVSVGQRTLGKAVTVLGPDGAPVGPGVTGELAVTAPWPGMTRGFWREGPERYLATYWSRFDGMWVHGDWASYDEDGFFSVHGRSDDTLNVAGKRLGPAEVEAVLDAHPAVVDAAVVGVPHPVKGEVLAAYCVLAGPPIDEADDDLEADVEEELRGAVVAEFGKAFALASLVFVEDLPRTRSGKVMRRLVRAAALGQEPGDLAGLDNPDALETIPRLTPPPR